MKQKHLFLFSAGFLILIFAVLTLVYQQEQAEQAKLQAVRNHDALVRDHSPRFGPPRPAVTIVEFLDPACETCREFYPLVKQLVAQAPDRIGLVIRYAPLHPGSDQVVAMLEAARLQERFSETLEAMFAAQPQWAAGHQPQPERLWPVLESIGLDLDRLRRDMNSPEVQQRIAQDVDDARALNVTMTPEFFVNGRPMPSFGYDQLSDLVTQALARTR